MGERTLLELGDRGRLAARGRDPGQAADLVRREDDRPVRTPGCAATAIDRAKLERRASRNRDLEHLLQAGYDPDLKIFKTIGYRQAFALLRSEMTRAEAIDDLKRSTRRYAKQQITWFRKDKSIIWLESSSDFVTIHKLIEDFHVI